MLRVERVRYSERMWVRRMLVPVLTQEDVARAVVAGVRSNNHLIVIPSMMKLVYSLHFYFPWLVQWLMTITGYRSTRRANVPAE